MAVKIIKQHCTKNICYTKSRKLDAVKRLIVHSPAVIKASGYHTNVIITGDEWYKRWNVPNLKKLAHGVIDVDGVHLFLPLDTVAYQVGNWYGNCNSIGFELCEYTDLKKAKKVYNIAVEYYAMLVKKYGLKVSDIIGHKEAHDVWHHGSNHSDPDDYFKTFGKSMKEFRKDVEKELKGRSTVKEETRTQPGTFKVKIISKDLNVRNGAGTDYKVNCVVKKNEVFTIVQTAKSCTWGKLKSGAGWISLNNKYVQIIE